MYVCSLANSGELFLILKERYCRRMSFNPAVHSNLIDRRSKHLTCRQGQEKTHTNLRKLDWVYRELISFSFYLFESLVWDTHEHTDQEDFGRVHWSVVWGSRRKEIIIHCRWRENWLATINSDRERSSRGCITNADFDQTITSRSMTRMIDCMKERDRWW